jgi:hypothetical protein
MGELYILILRPIEGKEDSKWLTMGPYFRKEDASTEGKYWFRSTGRKWVVTELDEAPNGASVDWPVRVCKQWSA